MTAYDTLHIDISAPGISAMASDRRCQLPASSDGASLDHDFPVRECTKRGWIAGKPTQRPIAHLDPLPVHISAKCLSATPSGRPLQTPESSDGTPDDPEV